MTPIVAIVGRPNVGKSTLFNRFVGHQRAIVSEVAGTTRDRISGTVSWKDKSVILVDTGGLAMPPLSNLWPMIKTQVDVAIAEADVVLLLTDVVDGIVPIDLEIAQSLRRKAKRVVLVVNKVDNPKREQDSLEFYNLGLGEPYMISAHHNTGISDLIVAIHDLLPDEYNDHEPSTQLKLAVIGRPNVGKSMLSNSILGDDRTIVSEIPGTTRDSIDISLSFQNNPITLIDTAGIRRRGRIEPGIEKYSILRTLRAIDRSNVCLLILDATESITAQDTHIAGQVLDAYKGVVVVVNKCDAVKSESELEHMSGQISRNLKFIPYAPICFTSALNNVGINNVMQTALKVYQEGSKFVSRGSVERALLSAVSNHMPPGHKGKSLKIYRGYQKSASPPTFVTFVNNPELVHFSYKRYLENQIRSEFGFVGNPIQMIFSTRGKG